MEKSTVNMIPNGKKLRACLLRLWISQRCALSPLLFSIVLGLRVTAIRGEENNFQTKWKRRGDTVTICTWRNTMPRESEDATGKWLELIKDFREVAGYETNKEKTLAFLYNKNKKSKTEAKEAVPFTMGTRRVKFLGINLPRLGRDWCTEKNKAWMKQRWRKEMERDTTLMYWKNQILW